MESANTTSPPRPGHHAHSHSHSHSHTGGGAGLSASTALPQRTNSGGAGAGHDQKFRASLGGDGARGWGGASPRAPQGAAQSARPSSELLNPGNAGSSFQSSETEAIDRWFEDLQHYETTLEEMATASLDINFKEELSAIEQWFRVLSEAERTAALYSLLQSSTQVQMRFFITVLQQMARADPMGSLMSPANPSQLSMEAQMEAKLASMGLKSPASPVIRQFARQSLGAGSAGDSYLSPNSAAATTAGGPSPPSPVTANMDEAPAAATLASQRAKLKASSRTSAPANLPLGANGNTSTEKSPLWSEKETVMERRSPSPRPKSTGSDGAHPNGAFAGQHLSHSTGPPSSASFLRSPALDMDNQLSPLVGGSWASMVNTPLVPMFAGKGGAEPGSTMAPGDFGGGLHSPGLDGAASRLGTWQRDQPTSPNPQGIVLDDVRKFRRSARVSGSGAASGFGVSGGALGGMYEEQQGQRQSSQQQQQDSQRRAQLSSMQQNAINLGLAGLPQQANSGGSTRNANGGLNSPGLINAQQAAVNAQQNWRNGLGSPGLGAMGGDNDQYAQQSNLGQNALSANAQLANLFALQQQMIQQQQQMQQLNNFAAAGLNLTPAQMMGLQQQQAQALLSPGRMGMGLNGMGMGFGGNGVNMGMGIGMNGGMPSPRRSPRSSDRSPGGNNSKTNVPNATGSGSNPEEPLDMNLLADVPQWLRSLRLHKYTPNFEGSNWKEMVQLDDAGLEGKGVSALGARRKLLKVFETVRIKMNMALPGDGALNANDGASTRSLSPNPGADSRDP